ncbi:MAG: 23S rRNA (adenine(2503)-C(2))-methyltransferase RlmN, partial [Rhodospirillales bacterium]|nr:23S rRNA (adenine(2503)-C(2))-methyltransferase RlmN [Rhodospirillales bacterium]
RAGYAAPGRAPRGRDIQAACGQLKSASVPRPRRREGDAGTVSAPAA